LNIVLNFIEKVFVLLTLILFTEPLALLEIFASDKNLIFRLQVFLLCIIGLITIAFIILYKKQIIYYAIKEKLLWLLVLISIFSIFWSAKPLWSVISSIMLLNTTLFGVYFGIRYSLKEQMQILAWAFGVSAILSIIFAVALPSYGVMGMGYIYSSQDIGHRGVWQGIYGHKNALGQYMSLGGLIFLSFTQTSIQYSWIAWIGFALSISLLLISTSKTALVVFLAVIALIPLYKALRWNHTFAIPACIFTVLVFGVLATLLVSNLDTVLQLLGRDIKLSGRTLLWAIIGYKIWQRPWLGYGYGGFWRGWEGESADVWRVVNWDVSHAHNGFLNLWLDIGLLGLSVFVVSYSILYLRAVSWVRITKSSWNLIPIIYLTFLLFFNFTESPLMKENIFWVLYVSLIFSMHKMSLNISQTYSFFQQKNRDKKNKITN
jgi:exopolysaccharide production protein ExoQ